MQSEAGVWDPATVLGLRSNEVVLVVGNSAFLPWLTSFFQDKDGHLLSAKRSSEVEQHMRDGHHFDKVILAKETQYTHDHLLRAAALRAQLVYFPQDDGWQFEQSVQFYYPEATVRRFDSTFGSVMTADVYGASWRVIHG